MDVWERKIFKLLKQNQMITLPTTYKKNGYNYNQVERNGDVAIFSQESEGRIYGYEVFEVRKNKEWTAFGKTFPAKESVPSSEQWGDNAFTCANLDHARLKAEFIQERIQERLQNQILTTNEPQHAPQT